MIFGTRTSPQELEPEQRTQYRFSSFFRQAWAVFARHPSWTAWSGLVVAMLCIFQVLGTVDGKSLGLWISSDTLYPVNLFTDLLKDGYSLSGWHFSIAPCWFPDIVATGFFWILTRNVIVATLLAGFVQIALLIGGLHFIGKALGVKYLALQDSLLLLMGVLIALFVSRNPTSDYPFLYKFFLPQTHVGSMVSVIWGWALALLLISRLRTGRTISRLLFLAYAILCVLAGMSNALFFPHMLVPFTAACFGAVFLGVMQIRECWRIVVTGWFSAGLGAVLNRTLFNGTGVGAQGGLSRDRVLTALDTFMRGFAGQVLSRDPLHLIALLWVAICSLYIAWTVRALIVNGKAQVSSERILRTLFLAACVLSSLLSAASIIVGGSNGLVEFKDYIWSMHYLLQAFLFPLLGIPLVFSWALERIAPVRAIRSAAWATGAVALVLPLVRLSGMPAPKTPIYGYQPPLVRLLDEIKSVTPVHDGLAGYWQARLITLLSKSGLRAYAVDGSLNPLLWVNNEQWYRQSLNDRKRPPQFDFVVLDDPLWKISRETVVRQFGEPAKELRQDGTRVLIYASPIPVDFRK